MKKTFVNLFIITIIVFFLLNVGVMAEDMGIYISAGQPEIVTASCSGGEASLTVKNDADTQGTFSAFISDCNFTMVYSAQSRTLEAQETATFVIPISSMTYNERCKLTVYDVNVPSNKVEVNTQCQATVVKFCIPGQQYTGAEAGQTCIYKCEADGQAKTKIKCCTGGLTYNETSATYDCAGSPETIQSSETEQIAMLLWYGIIIFSIGLLVGLMIMKKRLRK